MSRRNKSWFAALALVAAGVLLGSWPSGPSQREPVYGGLSLSVWLDRYDRGDPSAQMAIRTIGTNAVPALLRMLRARDSWARQQAYTSVALLHLPGIHIDSAVQRQILGLAGINSLGSAAANMLPDILPLLNDSNLCYAAAWAASATGSHGVRALACIATTNASVAARCAAVSGLGRAEQDRDFAAATLARCAKDSHFAVREAAARAIGQLRDAPASSVAALVAAVTDSNRVVRSAALEALGLFGKEAGNADAVVSRATNDPDPLVRSAAIIALDKIEGRTNKVRAGK